MPRCYVIGGLGESTLDRSRAGTQPVWIDLAVLMLGKLGEMRLAPDGTSPGEPDGVPLFATSGVDPYLQFPTLILAAQLLPSGYRTTVIPWDWRMAVYSAGVLLAAQIRTEVTSADPCAIVAHSAGGLVARAAWTELGLTGQTGLVRRIVTLGTPHWGSYSVVNYWQGGNVSIDWLIYANQQLGATVYGHAPDFWGYVSRPRLFYQQLGLTWPSYYDILPTLGAPDATADPNRALLYQASNWPAAFRPQQAWLDWSRDHTGPWLRSAASKPPPEVLTCVSGVNTTVPSALTSPEEFAQGGGLGQYVIGDNAVTRDSAELSTGVIWRYGIDHENLLPTLANSGELRDLILDVRSPGPAPTPEQSPDQQGTFLNALPFAVRPGQVGVPNNCLAGTCGC